MTIKVDTKTFEDGIKQLSNKYGMQSVVPIAEIVLEDWMGTRVDNLVPKGFGDLARSRVIKVVDSQKGIIRFGFNKIYAAFQDQGENTGFAKVVPRNKKRLYIPLTDSGRKHHRPGANPEDEGLVRGEDYVLAKEANIRIKPYGSPIGPNHYFSGSVKKHGKAIISGIAKLIQNAAAGGKVYGGNGGTK